MRDAPPENASVHLGNRLSMYRRMDLGSGQKDGSDELSRGGSTCERFSCLPASCHSIRYQNRVSNSQSETADRSRKLIGCTATRLVKSALTADMKCLHSHIYDRTLTQEREGVRHIMACYDMCAVIALQSGWKFSEFLTAGGGGGGMTCSTKFSFDLLYDAVYRKNPCLIPSAFLILIPKLDSSSCSATACMEAKHDD